MGTVLTHILIWVMGSAIARLLAGAGLAVGSYAVISDYIDAALAATTNLISGLGDVGALLYIAGIGEALSIIGSAVLASAALLSAKIFLARQ